MKKLILLILLVMTSSTYAQNYEAYVGSVISKDKDMHSNYMLGLNFTIDLNQNREYLNKLILGFEHSAYMSNGTTYTITSKTPITDNSCNCNSESLNLKNDSEFTIKKEVRAVSLNFGVNVCKGCWLKQLYLLTGVTSSKHITKVDNESVNEYFTTHIDAGAKYFIPINKWFISPTIKLNPETVSFGLGAGF